MCENLEALDEPEAKGSLIWIIGEYAERIDNADDLINIFLENFKEENPQVSLYCRCDFVLLISKIASLQGSTATIDCYGQVIFEKT